MGRSEDEGILTGEQIAASGLKAANAAQMATAKSSGPSKGSVTSAPRNGASEPPLVRPKNPAVLSQQKKSVQIAVDRPQEKGGRGEQGPEVNVEAAEDGMLGGREPATAAGLLAPSTAEDTNTQLSSSSGSGKPPSLDGKSVTSATTFAMDEKESLRPDDSASVQAVDDEDTFLPQLPADMNAVPLDDGARAFRDQLREISDMDPGCGSAGTFGTPTQLAKGVLYVPPSGIGVGNVPGSVAMPEQPLEPTLSAPDVKLLEALESPRDRLMVMKLQTDMVDFISDPKEVSLILPQCNAYHRMLAHKAADYYMLGHVADDSSSGVRLFKTVATCLRPPLADRTAPSTATSTPPPNAPQMKILRRGIDANPAIVNGSNVPSKSGSENGETGEDDEKKSKVPLSREEREARYEAVRLRIMGSARPKESTEDPKSKDNSRSSSANERKSKKKHRSDSDDGFDPRSVYTQLSTPSYSSQGFAPPAYAINAYSNTPVTTGMSQQQQNYMDHGQIAGYAGHPPQQAVGMQWPNQNYYNQSQPQQPTYDLSADFQHAMSFQGATPYPQGPAAPFNPNIQNQYVNQQQQWGQQNYQVQSPVFQQSNSYYGGYGNGSMPIQAPQQYEYGQLPSQAFPGRPSSKLEHPLPGSYKGKHFNPQSQAFVPGQQGASTPNPYAHSPSANSPFGVPGPLQRQMSAQSQSGPYGSPHHAQAVPAGGAAHSQPMMHPLPQPVFPRQPSPNIPLPMKPGPNAQQGPPAMYNQQGQSSIAKWGTPASLPAKPPPSAEPFDAARFPQIQRPASYNTGANSRMPNFGGMPPVGVGSGTYGQR